MISVCLFEEFGMASSCTSVSRSLTPLRCRPAREARLEGKQGQGPHGAPKPKPPTSQSTTSHISPPLTHTLWDKRSFQDPCQTKTAVANEVRKLASFSREPKRVSEPRWKEATISDGQTVRCLAQTPPWAASVLACWGSAKKNGSLFLDVF